MPLKALSITVSPKKPHETQRGCLQYQTNPVLSHPPLPTCEHTVPTLELPKRHQKYKTTFTTSPKPHHNVRINDSYFPHSFYTCNTTLKSKQLCPSIFRLSIVKILPNAAHHKKKTTGSVQIQPHPPTDPSNRITIQAHVDCNITTTPSINCKPTSTVGRQRC